MRSDKVMFSSFFRGLFSSLLAGLLALTVTTTAAAATDKPGCALDDQPRETLQQFVQEFERGDLAAMSARLDPAMLGLGQFLDAASLDFDRSKLVRIRLFDTSWQCGPDLVVVHTAWEKRYLDAAAYRPQLGSGRMSVLLFRASERWRLAAVAGPHPFGATDGAPADILFGPQISLAGLSPTPATVPVRLVVADADLTRRASISVVIRTVAGDREVFTLDAVAPGRFERISLPFALGNAQPGNGVLEVPATGGTLTLEYLDEPSGAAGATGTARALRRTAQASVPPVAPVPSPGGGDTDPDPFAFAPQPPAAPEAVVVTEPIVVRGINAPTPISSLGGSYSINGGPFTSVPGTVAQGDRVALQLQKDGAPFSTATLQIGPRSAVVSVPLLDREPDPISFPASVQPPLAVTTTAPVLLSGFNVGLDIEVFGGLYSINGGPFTSAPGVVRAGSTLSLRATASPLPGAVNEVVLLVGRVTTRWQVTTQAAGGSDTTPEPFTIPLGLATPLPSVVPPGCNYPTAAPVTPSGYNTTTTLNASAAQPFRTVEVSVGGGPFVVPPTSIGPGQSFVLRIQPFDGSRLAPSPTPQVVGSVNIGGTVATYAVRCN